MYKCRSILSRQPVTIFERAEVANMFSPVASFLWGERDDLIEAYEKIVFWRKNLFMLRTGSVGKKYNKVVTRLLNAWTQDTQLNLLA